jgi:hypothetical protein
MVAATAALSSCLSVGMVQAFSSAPAGAAPRASQVATPPSETDLLTEIAANTSTANGKLHVLGADLKSIRAAQKASAPYTKVSASRLKIIDTNLVAFYKKMASDLSYNGHATTKYVGNEAHLQEATLCEIEFWVQAESAGSAPNVVLPPCGNGR